MRTDNYFAVLIFFSLLGLIANTIFSSIIISKTNAIEMQNNNSNQQ